MEILRSALVEHVIDLLGSFPVVALIGPRQVGKTTTARQLIASYSGRAHFFDLESPRDLARLQDPLLTLESLEGLVVLDEIQRLPDVFPVLRVLADRRGTPARFLVLGSASPELLRQSSETLAGRIAYHEVTGFSLEEIGARSWQRRWLRGGMPRAYLARDDAESHLWREQFLATFLERDLPQLGSRVPSEAMRRFWSMLAHLHGQVMNYSRLARSLDVSDATIRRYLDLLTSSFVVRRLQSWSENLGKRQVKAPKVYLADSGLLHALLGIVDVPSLQGHPVVGASWEGFAMDQVLSRVGARWRDCHFWATHGGAELDLLIVSGGRRLGFEFKRTSAPSLTRSMKIAQEALRLDSLEVIYPGPHRFPLAQGIDAVPLSPDG